MKYKLTFNTDDINSIVLKIKSKEGKIQYLTKLSKEYKKIFIEYNDSEILALISKFKLNDKFEDEKKTKELEDIIEWFREWLNEDIRPFVGNSIALLKYDIGNSRYEIEQEEINIKYPTYDFNETTIIYRCNKDYPDYNERITYLEFVIEKFRIFVGEYDADWFYDAIGRPSLKNFVPKIQREIEKLKRESILFEKIINKSVNQTQMKLNKFKWSGTEKGILLLFDFLFYSKFIEPEEYKLLAKILSDTFLNNEGKPFNNKQLSTVRDKIEKIEKNKYKISIVDDDHPKYQRLISILNKSIET